MQLTENFRLEEFAGNDAGQTPVPPEYLDNVTLLAHQLEVVRQKIGKPIIITSGYRTPEHNADPDVGGVSNSRHLTAKGADLYADMPFADLYCVFDRLMKLGPANGGIINGGLGIYAGHVHYDTRGTPSRWTGQGIAVPNCPPPQEEEEVDPQARADIEELQKAQQDTRAFFANIATDQEARIEKGRAFDRGIATYVGAVGELAAANQELGEFNEAKIAFLIGAVQKAHPEGDGATPDASAIAKLQKGQADLKARVAAAEAARLAAAKALAGVS